MTDTTASGSSSLPEGNGWLGDTPAANHSPAAIEGKGWETVTFPGQLVWPEGAEGGAASHPEPLPAVLLPDPRAELSEFAAELTAEGGAPESGDLMQLVQDLNQCNDALLLRVTELEEALERSQVALQAEVERHQAHPAGLPGATPGPVQQQIAQLLSELDIANDGLRRTTIHNEALQAELEVNQQRVAQLERECTLLQQRFSERSTALHQAEATCRDLKARLHRQQRYTLQFKAALEKCLNMAPSSTATPIAAPPEAISLPEAMNPAVTMPRTQQIKPWSAEGGAPVDQPSLGQLLRGLRQVTPPPQPPSPPPTAPVALAESAIPDSVFDPVPDSIADAIAALGPFELLPPGVLPEVESSPEPAPTEAAPDPWAAEPSPAVSLPPTEDSDLRFTEPSPWGEPVLAAEVPPVAPPTAPPVQEQPATLEFSGASPAPAPAPPLSAPSLPAYLTTGERPSPSPLVYPLRSQKKIKSIAAVELPSFGRSARQR